MNHMAVKRAGWVALLVFGLSACSTVPTQRENQTAIGASTGAAIGGALGNVISDDTKGTLIGAIIGGIVGSIVGHNYSDKQAEVMGLPSPSEIASGVTTAVMDTAGLDAIKMADGSMKINVAADAGFNSGSAAIKDSYLNTLEKISKTIQTSAYGRVVIIGHTDNTGVESANQTLSLARATNVRNYLESTGIAASRMQVYGRGSTQAIVSNETLEGRIKNRRVEIYIYPTGK